MHIDLMKIADFHDSGTSDMGSLTFGRTIGAGAGTVDDNDKARFWLPNVRYGLVSIRGHFDPVSGSGVNDFVIRVDSGMGEAHDTALMTIENAGTGTNSSDIHFRVCEEDQMHWIFDGRRNDTIVCTWTNPDTIRWGLEVFLAPIVQFAAQPAARRVTN